jgi:hypothetical protein
MALVWLHVNHKTSKYINNRIERFYGDRMEEYQKVAEHILDAISHGHFTIGGIIEDAKECYGDAHEMVNLVLGMLVERGVLKVNPTGVDLGQEALPVSWWSVYPV